MDFRSVIYCLRTPKNVLEAFGGLILIVRAIAVKLRGGNKVSAASRHGPTEEEVARRGSHNPSPQNFKMLESMTNSLQKD